MHCKTKDHVGTLTLLTLVYCQQNLNNSVPKDHKHTRPQMKETRLSQKQSLNHQQQAPW